MAAEYPVTEPGKRLPGRNGDYGSQTMAARNGIITANAAAMTASTKTTMAAGPMYFVTEKLDMDGIPYETAGF